MQVFFDYFVNVKSLLPTCPEPRTCMLGVGGDAVRGRGALRCTVFGGKGQRGEGIEGTPVTGD